MFEPTIPNKIELQKTAILLPYARNSRTHSDAQIQQIASSIKEFGFTNPILIDENNQIIAGHGRLSAAHLLKIKEVPCIRLAHLTEAQKKAYVIADNKLALNAGWDDAMLALELKDLESENFDLSLTGFNEDELAKLLVEAVEGQTDPDDVPEVQETAITVLGDIWTLGKHRLMCGDSTSIDAVDKLMDGQKADMVFTDPPYNVSFNGRSGKHEVIKNDNLSDKDFENFIIEIANIIKTIDPKAYYIWCNWKFYGILQNLLEYKACIVWAKNVFGMGNGYRHQHEFCMFNGKIDEIVKNESDLWEIKKDTNYVHPTQKPVALSIRAFSNHIKLVKILDLFGGSGSTLIGAEQTGREAYLMELDPKYCDVIIRRWQDFTGKNAVHSETGKTFNEMMNERSNNSSA
jgi:DNA modification methylase